MPLCGRFITKPGYSSFCEALSQNVGIHLVQRDGFAEAAVLQRDLQNHGAHRLLSREAFSRGDWQLDQPLLHPGWVPCPPAAASRLPPRSKRWSDLPNSVRCGTLAQILFPFPASGCQAGVAIAVRLIRFACSSSSSRHRCSFACIPGVPDADRTACGSPDVACIRCTALVPGHS